MNKPLLTVPAFGVKPLLGERCQGGKVPVDALYYWDGALYPCTEIAYDPETHRVTMPGGLILAGDTALNIYPAGTRLEG